MANLKERIVLRISYGQGSQIAGEEVWAWQIAEKTARIDCEAFLTAEIGCGDVVRFDEDHVIVAVLQYAEDRATREPGIAALLEKSAPK